MGFTGTLAPVKKRLIVGITGATGAIYGLALLRALKEISGWESHLVHKMKRKDVERLADYAYHPKDIAATLSSGSFLTEGMVIAPCSMKTLAAVAHAHADDLVSRAADVVLKERRRLVLVPRETPLNLAHLRNMVAVTEMGGIIMPPMPAFYALPKTLDDLVAHTVGRILDLFGLRSAKVKRWQGLKGNPAAPD